MSIRLSIVLCLIIICLTWQIQAKCILRIEPLNGPLIVRNFGLKKIIMKRNYDIEMEEDESIESYCSSGYSLTSSYGSSIKIQHQNHAIWTCENDIISSTISKYFRQSKYLHTIGCLSQAPLEMFQSATNLTDCDDSTLVLGNKLDTERNNIKSAALCFDPVKQKLKFLSFIAHAKTNVLMNEILGRNELDYLRLDKKVFGFHNLFEFMSPPDFDMVSETLNQKYNEYDSQLFVYDSLMQFNTDLSSYEDVLNIVWSKRLKNGSWRMFMDALYMQSIDEKYQVRLGTDGLIQLEVTGNCNMTQPLIYKKNDLLVKAPNYVWAHLKELQSSIPKPMELKPETEPEEFIVIGFNSPYLNLAELTNAYSLCPNICEKIPWLSAHDFNKMRLKPLYGVVICCRVEDVIDKLEDFPYTRGETFNFNRILNTETILTTTLIPKVHYSSDYSENDD